MHLRHFAFRLTILTFGICALVAQADKLTVNAQKAAIFAAPSASAKVLSYVPKGKALESTGDPQNGFYPLKTKSGRKVFVKVSDVEKAEESIEGDLVSEATEPKSNSFRRFRFDGGGAVGSSNQGSFYEVNLGVSYYVMEWLIWRNAPFFRFQSGAENAFGLDSSIRGQISPPVAPEFSPSFLVGAGFRFINTGSHAPFAEVGLGLRVSEVNIQVGIKYIANKLIHDNSDNEMIFNGGFTVSGSF